MSGQKTKDILKHYVWPEYPSMQILNNYTITKTPANYSYLSQSSLY